MNTYGDVKNQKRYKEISLKDELREISISLNLFLGELEAEKDIFNLIPFILVLYNEKNIGHCSANAFSNKKLKIHSAKFSKEFSKYYVLFNEELLYIKDAGESFLCAGLFNALTSYYFFSKNIDCHYRIDNFSYEIIYTNIL